MQQLSGQMKFHLLLILLLTGFSSRLAAQFVYDVEQSVKVTAVVANNPPTITVNWIEDPGVISYYLYRRVYGDTTWGTKIATYQPEITQHVDTDVQPHVLYEYKVVKLLADIEGYGYVLSAIERPPVHYEGEVLLLVTEPTLTEIAPELNEYRAVLETDGWTSQLLTVTSDQSPAEVKADISAAHVDRPFSALFILGDVPIPHSGDINPDAHTNHQGAWAADVYYGDLNGEWTDSTVTNTSAATPVNHNLPGDGKWDQSYLPSDVEVAVGRADFSNLPAFGEDEFELLRNYLRKDIDFRTAQFTVNRIAAIRNTNPWDGGLGQNGIRNFSALVGPENISYNTWEAVFDESHLWYYGSGGGSQTSAVQMGSTQVYANQDFQAVFTAWFGSYFGDYDFPDNYLRATLGSGDVLSAVWAGAPHWHFHSMAMGFPLAHATTVTQNNDTIYTADYFPRGVHVNLLGDPTLKGYPVAPPTEVTSMDFPTYHEVSWIPSPDDGVSKYYIYRKIDDETTYSLIDSTDRFATRYQDITTLKFTEKSYLIRAAKLEVTPSGSFHNLSTGAVGNLISTTANTSPEEEDTVFFPNPAKDLLIVRSASTIRSIELIDNYGQTVLRSDRTGNSVNVNVDKLATGTYVVRVTLIDRVVNKVLVIW